MIGASAPLCMVQRIRNCPGRLKQGSHEQKENKIVAPFFERNNHEGAGALLKTGLGSSSSFISKRDVSRG